MDYALLFGQHQKYKGVDYIIWWVNNKSLNSFVVLYLYAQQNEITQDHWSISIGYKDKLEQNDFSDEMGFKRGKVRKGMLSEK